MSASWTDKHTKSVVRAIIAGALASRSAMYALPDLAAVNGNGGDRINKKLQQILVGLEKSHGLDGAVKEEVGRLKGMGRGGGSGKKGVKVKTEKEEGGKVKVEKGAGRKKRKVEKEEEEDWEDEEEDGIDA